MPKRKRNPEPEGHLLPGCKPVSADFGRRSAEVFLMTICEHRRTRATNPAALEEIDEWTLETAEKLAGAEAPTRNASCGDCPGCSPVRTAHHGATLH
jgi:hypothetical protein